MTFKKGIIPWNKGKIGVYKEEVRRRISNTLKGHNVSEQTKERLRIAHKGRKYNKMSESSRKNISNDHRGIKFTEEHKRKIGLATIGRKVSIETRQKIRQGNLGKKYSAETKLKMSKSNKGKHHSPLTEFKKGHKNKHSEETKQKIRNSLLGKHRPEEVKKKLRLATIKYIREVCNNLHPMIGHNEKKILDELENEIGHKIIRQYEIEGYFLDGYVKELNLAIEVDERPKNKERDIERENIIKNKLNCTFMRIKDYD